MTHRAAPHPARHLKRRTVPLLVLLALAMAPTAGNIGSCGQEAILLGDEEFFAAKQSVDCVSCTECGLATLACQRACADEPVVGSFPEGCAPLVHDGEVCLDALSASSCDEYTRFMADQGATIPTECNFCPLTANGSPSRGGS